MRAKALLIVGIALAAIGLFLYKADADARANYENYGLSDPGIDSSGYTGIAVAAIGLILTFGALFILASNNRTAPAPQSTPLPPTMPPSTPPDGARQPCPRCGESIPVAAKVCRFCGHELASPSLGH